MGFSYHSCDGTNDQVDLVRLLISDTQSTNHVFEDSEIEGAYRIQALQFQSSMFYSGAAGANLPASPVSVLRVAALLIDALATDQARLAAVTQLLDVHLSPDKAAQSLHAQAANWRQVDDESGAFVIIEQCSTEWAFKDRFWKQVQRLSAS